LTLFSLAKHREVHYEASICLKLPLHSTRHSTADQTVQNTRRNRKHKGCCFNDLRVAEQIQSVQDKMDIQRAPNAMQREKGMAATAVLDGKLMLHFLRAKPHKEHSVEELRLRAVTCVTVATS
jgi:hypothetical protein